MHALLLSRSLHGAVPNEQYGPGNSSGLGIVISGGLACIDMLPGIPLPLGDILLTNSMAFCILGLVQALTACTGHLLH